MRAVILAAGKGTRLGKAADGLPKCLLQIGGQPLIFQQLGALADAGVSPVTLIVGYAADLVRETVGNRAEFVLNPRYETTNSLYSLHLAADSIKGPVLVLNSDVLVAPEILERLLKAGEDSLVFDSTSGSGPEHMKVAVLGGCVKNLSKSLPNEESAGENVGIIYLSEKSARVVFAKARELIDAGRTNAFLAEAICASLTQISLRAVDVAGIPWTEIDTPYDLERARREIWPQIQNGAGSRLIDWRRRRNRRLAVWSVLGAAILIGVFTGGWLMSASSPVQTWDTMSAQTGSEVTLMVKDMPQTWWLAENQEIVKTNLAGPRKVRIEVRCLMPKSTRRVPFAFEVRLDGELHEVFMSRAIPDSKAVYEAAVVSDRDKVELNIPEGKHSVDVRLNAGKVDGLMVRFRVFDVGDE